MFLLVYTAMDSNLLVMRQNTETNVQDAVI